MDVYWSIIRLSYDLYVTFALLPDSLKYLRMLAAPLKINRKDLSEINQELILRAQLLITATS